MVTVYNWVINGDFLDADVEVAAYSKKFKIRYAISTEKTQTSEAVPDHVHSEAKRAVIQVYLDFIGGKLKMGEKRVVAWG